MSAIANCSRWAALYAELMATDRQMNGSHEAVGPRSWRNWQVQKSGGVADITVELPLYSDAWFSADARDLGPYSLLNTVPGTTPGSLYEWKPAAVLRVEHVLLSHVGDMSVTGDKHYHGGTLYDEVAALVGLHLGIRLVAGPVEREFGLDEDPLGRPRGHSTAMLPNIPARTDAPQIPSLFGSRSLAKLEFMSSYVSIEPEAASVLVKSARLYQQALWVADTSPELAWLLLVSSLEAAAGFWNEARLTPAQQLELSYSKLAKRLKASNDPEIFELVVDTLKGLIGSTGKFVTFCVEFAPPPPENRPVFGRFDFAPDSYKSAIKKIYSYRSRALHGGTPFPHPMCLPPRSDLDDTGIPEEKMSALGASSRGATWIAADVPMYLHLFAYITRGVLMNWWRTLQT